MGESGLVTDARSDAGVIERENSWRDGWRILLAFWKAYADRVSFYQAGVALAVIYALVVAPTSLLARLFRHRFLPSWPADAATFWHDTEMGSPPVLDDLRRQG